MIIIREKKNLHENLEPISVREFFSEISVAEKRNLPVIASYIGRFGEVTASPPAFVCQRNGEFVIYEKSSYAGVRASFHTSRIKSVEKYEDARDTTYRVTFRDGSYLRLSWRTV